MHRLHLQLVEDRHSNFIFRSAVLSHFSHCSHIVFCSGDVCLVLVLLGVHSEASGTAKLPITGSQRAFEWKGVGVDHFVHLERAQGGEVLGAGGAEVGALPSVSAPVDVDAALPGEASATVPALIGLEAGVHPTMGNQVLASAEYLLALVTRVGAVPAVHHHEVGLHCLPDDVAAPAVWTRAHEGLGHRVHFVQVPCQ